MSMVLMIKDADNENRIELLKLTQHLWDGDWCVNLRKIIIL